MEVPQHILDFCEKEYKTTGNNALINAAAIPDERYLLTTLKYYRLDIDFKDKHDQTPLTKAAACGLYRNVVILVNHGADVNFTGYNNQTALHDAVFVGNIKMIEFLLESKANVNAITNDDCTPLCIAITYHGGNHINHILLPLLLKYGADANLCQPMHHALNERNVFAINYLLDHTNIDLSKYCHLLQNTLRKITSPKVFKRLIQKGAPVNESLYNTILDDCRLSWATSGGFLHEQFQKHNVPEGLKQSYIDSMHVYVDFQCFHYNQENFKLFYAWYSKTFLGCRYFEYKRYYERARRSHWIQTTSLQCLAYVASIRYKIDMTDVPAYIMTHCKTWLEHTDARLYQIDWIKKFNLQPIINRGIKRIRAESSSE